MRKKKDSEYHTGRLNISCPPSVKDAIAADATAADQSISHYIIGLYEKSKEAGTSEHLARMGLELLGIKKGLIEADNRLRRALARTPNAADPAVLQEVVHLRDQRQRIDDALKELLEAVKDLREQGR